MAKRGTGAAVDSLMSNMRLGEKQNGDQNAHDGEIAAKTEQANISPTINEKAQNGENTKRTKRETHKVFSFWAPKEEIVKWNCYQEASAGLPKREDLGLTAIREYIERHPLTGEERTMYDLLLKREGVSE